MTPAGSPGRSRRTPKSPPAARKTARTPARKPAAKPARVKPDPARSKPGTRPARAEAPPAADARHESLLLAAVLDVIGALVVVFDREGRILRFNRACEALTGYRAAEVEGRIFWDFLLAPEDVEPIRRAFLDIVAGTPYPRGENDWVTRGGERRLIAWSNSMLPDASGAVEYVLATGVDITERRRAERELADSEARFRAVVEQASDGIAVLDRDYRFLDVNARACEMTGYARGELVGTLSTDLLLPGELGARPLSRERFARGEPVLSEHRLRRKDGAVAHCEMNSRLMPDGRVLSIMRDVTERVRAREALRESESRYRAVLEQASDGIIIADERYRLLEVNARACEMTGYTREELLRMSVTDFLLPEDLAAHPLQRERLAGGGIVLTERRARRKDGTVIHAEISSRLLPDGGMLSIARDVTERKAAEERLAESERRLERAQRIAHVGSFAADLTAWTAEVSAEMARICGMPAGPCTLTFDQFKSYVAPDDVGKVEGSIRGAMEDGLPFAHEIRVVRPDGGLRVVEVSGEPAVDGAGRVARILGTMQDVTERRYLEGQLREAQKLEAIGRLAGGVAHDFNNLLTVILGFGEGLMLDLPVEDKRRPAAVQIRAAARRAAALTQQLLAFGRRQRLELRELDLNGVLVELREILQRLVGDQVSLVVTPAARHSVVRADRGQKEQVLMNLALNARDAMPDGGTLRIGTRDLEPGERGASPAAPMLELTVGDTGQGMSPEVQAHIFEPFYTTKEVGHGAGLGLASVYGTVTQTGGTIEVESAPGQGSTFRIHLPSMAGAGSAEPAAPAVATVPGGEETVLMVEDEPAVRGLVTEVLRRKGYRVLEAGDGQEALEMARRHAGPLHLLVADIVMPGMGGRDVARRLAAERPGLRVLLISGYGIEPGDPYGGGPGLEAFLQKPFTPAALARRVREILDGPGPAAEG